ncbi:MAG TPA: cytochrome P450 [Planctomycetaceae bacterium]|nr:cytochrome P450 [Planctomycetaceae bacterium]
MSTITRSSESLGSRPRSRRPPGPWGPLHYLRMVQAPLAYFQSLREQYGPIVRVPLGPLTAYLVSDPDAIQHVLKDNAANYTKDTVEYQHLMQQVMGRSLLTSDGAYWRRQRRLLQPAFDRASLERYANQVSEATTEWLDRLPLDKPFDIARELRRLALTIIGRCLFSADFLPDSDRIGRAVDEVNATGGCHLKTVLSYIPGCRGPYRTAVGTLDQLMRLLIQERRAKPGPDDMLSLLLDATDEETGRPLTDDQIRNELVTFLLAGHETTAGVLSWAVWMLARHPESERTLLAELQTVLGGRSPTGDDLPRLPYTNAVFQEAMRLYPPIWVIPRRATEADELCGYVVLPGTSLMMSPYVVHRDPALWNDPDAFRPERFLDATATTRPGFAFFPFGGGPRTCIGGGFAKLEGGLILSALMQRFHVQVDPRHRVVAKPGVTLQPYYGIRVMLSPRTSGDDA